MKKRLLQVTFVSIISLLCAITNLANAGIIHNFIFDNLAQWDEVKGITNGDSLNIMFDDNTDFNNVQWSDIEYFQYHLSVGRTEKLDTFSSTIGLASELFSESNGVVSLTLNRLGKEHYISGYNLISNLPGYIHSGELSYFFATYYDATNQYIDSAYLMLETGLDSITYTSKTIGQVSEPSTLAVLLLALFGLISRQFKQQMLPITAKFA